jgi:hypothetical protein
MIREPQVDVLQQQVKGPICCVRSAKQTLEQTSRSNQEAAVSETVRSVGCKVPIVGFVVDRSAELGSQWYMGCEEHIPFRGLDNPLPNAFSETGWIEERSVSTVMQIEETAY